jgi:hypothetical protein
MIAKIKHVAFMSHNAPRLCRFYECLFGLTRARADISPSSEEEFAKRSALRFCRPNAPPSPMTER